jgi:VWFA-related protein
MRGRLSIALLGLLLLTTAAVVSGQDPSVTTPQTFRAATDLVLVDVSVLDRNRQPVRGLAAPDFTVLIDGQPRRILTFKALDATAPTPSSAPPVESAPAASAWTREIAPDVASNRAPSTRAIAILIDDYSIGEARLDPGQIQHARLTALSVIDALGPDDRAAVLFSGNRHAAQTFTTDRRRLRTAVENAAIVPEPPDIIEGIGPGDQGFCPCGVCSIQAIERISRTLRALPDQRKIVFYISAGPLVSVPRSYVNPTSPEVANGALRKEYCAWERYRATDRAMRQAQLANVTIDAFDPTGVHLGRHTTPNTTPKLSSGSSPGEAGGQYEMLEDAATLRTEALRAFADATGGRAIVNNNDAHLQVPAVLAESAAYYLLGVALPPAGPAGRFHPIQVRVSRQDVDVRTRAGYFDPTADERKDFAALAAAGAMSSIVGPLPAAGIPMEVAAAPVATEGGAPELALAITLSPPPGDARPLPRVEGAELVAALFNPETGDLQGSHEARLSLTWAKDAPFGVYEVIARLPASPGQHELRVGVKTDDGRTGSVYTSVEVPAFDDGWFVSGLVLNAVPSPIRGETSSLAGLLPVVPTARRTFRDADAVMAFLRVTQEAATAVPARVTTSLANARGEIVATDALDLDAPVSGTRWSADYEVVLPVDTLRPGDYLMTADVAAGARSARRVLRFRME